VLDKKVFPGIQGGPLMHVIAGKAVCFNEVMQPEFKEYAHQIIKNAKQLEITLKEEGFRLVSGGTDNHMVLVDTMASCGITGKKAEHLLDLVGITCNKNSIPFDKEKPFYTSGIRLGSPAMTTKGYKEEEFRQIALWISEVLHHPDDEDVINRVRKEVRELTSKF
jgi:glycine hydroxymethyltransferase